MKKINSLLPIPLTTGVKDRLYGILFMCLATFFWALLELLAQFIPAEYNALQTVWVRYATHLVFMLAVFGPTQGFKLVRTRQLKLQLFRPLLMIGMPLCFIFGASYMPVQNVLAEFWTAPLMGMGLALVFLGERISWPRWAMAVLGLGAVLLIHRPHSGVLSWSALFPLGMAFCYSLYCIMTRMLRTESTLTNLFYTALIVLVFWSWGLPFFWQGFELKALVPMALIGLLGYASLFFLDKAYERAPASVVAPFTYTQPIFLIILAYLLFGWVPGRAMLLGSLILVSMGIYLIFYEITKLREPDKTRLEPAQV